MRNLIFEENLGREEFNSLALTEKSRVKAHFLGSYEWGEGAHLTATGHILHNGRKTLVCETEIRDEEGTVLCKATANFFVIGQCVAEL
ncbi:PaaI family thioesterase [Anaerovibrio slackiae]|uniref:PaaI family thioesterase n=1 Tax=Anaerovibrio slackiae TaxID=2652309 RepID=UPI00386ADB9F